MRGARNAQVLKNEAGQICAISLGADFVSEHEWGITNTYRSFGIAKESIGVNPVGHLSRMVTRVPEDRFVLMDFNKPKRPRSDYSVGWKGTLLLLKSSSYNFDPAAVDIKDLRELYDHAGKDNDQFPLSTAWSDGDFAVFARKPDEIQFLKDLYEAFQNNDVMIWLGGGGVFQNAGLCFGIVSRMDAELLDGFRTSDEDRISLEAADLATGIKMRLEAASDASGTQDSWNKPFRYYALSPKWATEIKSTKDGTIKTAHKVIYWLNPMDQENFNAGWFTVEQLDQWIAGTGPVLGGRNARKSA